MRVEGGNADEQFDERYRAISARDRRFDGQFVTAVITTGIYCRPSCPARTPKPGNVTFFLTAAAAHEAGFRACKRCLPDATPESPLWNNQRDVASRAMRLIADGVVDREGVEGISDRLGYTTRHVNRLVTAELGAGPQALARARRAQSARSLLVGTNLGMAAVAFAAGFGSVRQFNETIVDVYGVTPRALRGMSSRLAPVEHRHGGPTRLNIDLPFRHPFDARGIFGFLSTRAIRGVEAVTVDDGAALRYARTLLLPHGPAAVDISARCSGKPDRWQLTAELELTSLADLAPAVSRIRRLLDLDADPAAVDSVLGLDPALAPLVASSPGIRVPGAMDPEELVMRAMVGQQISVKAATSHLTRLTELLGTAYPSAFEGLTMLFPTSAQIAEGVSDSGTPERPLRLPSRNVTAIRAMAAAMASGAVRIHYGMDREELSDLLMAQPQVGPWSASYIAMRVLGDPDIWLEADAALAAGAKNLGLVDPALTMRDTQRSLSAKAHQWAPWRSYAAMHVWHAASVAPRMTREPTHTSTTHTSTTDTSTTEEPPMPTAFFTTIQTPDGPFSFISREGQVLASGWDDDVSSLVPLIHASLRPADSELRRVEPGEEAAVVDIADAVRSYYDGDHDAPGRIAVVQHSGEFRQHAWEVLRTVEPGKPITYTEYAARAGRPAAIRAAASACAKNAAALFVPCHRIIRSDGGLGGFRYGLDIKRSLLQREAEARA